MEVGSLVGEDDEGGELAMLAILSVVPVEDEPAVGEVNEGGEVVSSDLSGQGNNRSLDTTPGYSGRRQ